MTNSKHGDEPAANVAVGAPSAPPIASEELRRAGDENNGRSVYPSIPQNTSESAPQRAVGQVPYPYNEPPPSYHSVVDYPTTPYPSGSVHQMPPPAGGMPYYMPKPPTHPHPGTAQAPPATVTHVITVGFGSVCPHCNVGVLQKETDLCCLLCLILLTIFTFPFGLVFLCCIPWTVTRRCPNCRRIVRNS